MTIKEFFKQFNLNKKEKIKIIEYLAFLRMKKTLELKQKGV